MTSPLAILYLSHFHIPPSSFSPTYEREEAFKWFQNCLTDLEVSTQTRFFEERLLSLRPEDVSESAFECFKAYFESINVTNGSMRKGTNPPFVSFLIKVTFLNI